MRRRLSGCFKDLEGNWRRLYIFGFGREIGGWLLRGVVWIRGIVCGFVGVWKEFGRK